MELHIIALIIAGIASFFACVLSVILIFQHLADYQSPPLQRYVVRCVVVLSVTFQSLIHISILIMVPVYAIDSFLSLLFWQHALWFDLVRDSYEVREEKKKRREKT